MLSLSTFMPFGPLATFAAFLAMFLLSQMWLSPLMFSRGWVRHSGIRSTDMRPTDLRRIMLTTLISRAVWALLLGAIASHLATSPIMLFPCALMLWLVCTFEQLSGILSRREPIALYVLITMRTLFTLLLGALVYYLWSIL